MPHNIRRPLFCFGVFSFNLSTVCSSSLLRVTDVKIGSVQSEHKSLEQHHYALVFSPELHVISWDFVKTCRNRLFFFHLKHEDKCGWCSRTRHRQIRTLKLYWMMQIYTLIFNTFIGTLTQY